MNNNRKEFVLVIGKSQNMNQEDVIEGLNSIVETQRPINDESTYSMMFFNEDCKMTATGKSMRAMRKYNKKTYLPKGKSAILDAVGFAVTNVGEALADTPEEQRPCRVCVIIIGESDNASTHFDENMICEMINVQKHTYKWDFVLYTDSPVRFDIHKGGNMENSKKMFNDINNYITALRR